MFRVKDFKNVFNTNHSKQVTTLPVTHPAQYAVIQWTFLTVKWVNMVHTTESICLQHNANLIIYYDGTTTNRHTFDFCLTNLLLLNYSRLGCIWRLLCQDCLPPRCPLFHPTKRVKTLTDDSLLHSTVDLVIIFVVTPHLKMHACHWSKSHHVTFSKLHYFPHEDYCLH